MDEKDEKRRIERLRRNGRQWMEGRDGGGREGREILVTGEKERDVKWKGRWRRGVKGKIE